MYLAVTGVGVAGADRGQTIRTVRNPLLHPTAIFKTLFKYGREPTRDNFKRSLEISDYLHPGLTTEGDHLEFTIHQFSACVFKLLVDEGANVPICEMKLAKLSD